MNDILIKNIGVSKHILKLHNRKYFLKKIISKSFCINLLQIIFICIEYINILEFFKMQQYKMKHMAFYFSDRPCNVPLNALV